MQGLNFLIVCPVYIFVHFIIYFKHMVVEMGRFDERWQAVGNVADLTLIINILVALPAISTYRWPD